MMRDDPFDLLPSIPKSQVWREFHQKGGSAASEERPAKWPTLALRLSLSAFGRPPREGFVPMRFFSEEGIQIYMGLPSHRLNKLMLFSGETTSRKIVDIVYPRYREIGLLFEERFALTESLPISLKSWFEPISVIIRRIRQGGWTPAPLYLLNFRPDRNNLWIMRAEHLCGQVPDGTHRILAYTMLGSEFPNFPVPVRMFFVRPWTLAAMNCATILIRLCMDPVHTPGFLKKRFSGSARVLPTKMPPAQV